MVKIIKEFCINCGACISACPEGFEYSGCEVKLTNSKAKGMNEAISVCPVDAIK